MEKNNFTIPAAIIVAGALIAGALFITRGGTAAAKKDNTQDVGQPNLEDIVLRPVDDKDHIYGDPNAPVKIVEYSDTECPFCKSFQPTMQQIMNDYGKDGKVAWVYRHFPLYKGQSPLHPKAEKEAEATECVNELGGADKFWQYLNKIYEITPSNNGLDPAKLPELAVQLGINQKDFESCLNSGRYTQKISDSYDEALAAGANGTPYSVAVTKDGKKVPISGAQPYQAVKAVIDTLLKENQS